MNEKEIVYNINKVYDLSTPNLYTKEIVRDIEKVIKRNKSNAYILNTVTQHSDYIDIKYFKNAVDLLDALLTDDAIKQIYIYKDYIVFYYGFYKNMYNAHQGIWVYPVHTQTKEDLKEWVYNYAGIDTTLIKEHFKEIMGISINKATKKQMLEYLDWVL